MKFASLGKLPWDMMVFLTITTVGLGVSFKRLAYPEKIGVLGASEEISANGIIDLGCIDRKGGVERLPFIGMTLRVKGQLCNVSKRQVHQLGGIRVRNITSQEEGTVFLQGTQASFISNEMALKKGKNLVQVEWRDPNSGKDRLLKAELFEP